MAQSLALWWSHIVVASERWQMAEWRWPGPGNLNIMSYIYIALELNWMEEVDRGG